MTQPSTLPESRVENFLARQEAFDQLTGYNTPEGRSWLSDMLRRYAEIGVSVSDISTELQEIFSVSRSIDFHRSAAGGVLGNRTLPLVMEVERLRSSGTGISDDSTAGLLSPHGKAGLVQDAALRILARELNAPNRKSAELREALRTLVQLRHREPDAEVAVEMNELLEADQQRLRRFLDGEFPKATRLMWAHPALAEIRAEEYARYIFRSDDVTRNRRVSWVDGMLDRMGVHPIQVAKELNAVIAPYRDGDLSAHFVSRKDSNGVPSNFPFTWRAMTTARSNEAPWPRDRSAEESLFVRDAVRRILELDLALLRRTPAFANHQAQPREVEALGKFEREVRELAPIVPRADVVFQMREILRKDPELKTAYERNPSSYREAKMMFGWAAQEARRSSSQAAAAREQSVGSRPPSPRNAPDRPQSPRNASAHSRPLAHTSAPGGPPR